MYGYIHLKNFKCYEDEFINLKDSRNRVLREVHFVGENLSGKSSLLSVFSFFQELALLNYNHNVAMTKRFCLRSRGYKLPFMKKLVAEHRNYFSDEGIELEFEIIIKNNKYYYKLAFDSDNNLEYESLVKTTSKNTRLLFARDKDTYTSGRGVIRVKDKDDFDEHFAKNKDNFTLLSMIYLKVYTGEIESSSDIHNLCSFILLHHINNDNHTHIDLYNFDKDDHRSLVKGIVSIEYLFVLESTAPVINLLLNSISDVVDDVKYEINYLEEDLIEYELLVKQRSHNNSVWLKEANWPPIYFMAIEIIDAMNDASFDGIVILDNITDKLHYNTLKKIIEGFNKHTTGQTIFTSNSSVYLNDIEHNSIFILKNKEDKYFVQSVVDDFNYRSEHNIRVRYERGVYGTINKKAPKSIISYQEKIDSEIKKYLNKINSKFINM